MVLTMGSPGGNLDGKKYEADHKCSSAGLLDEGIFHRPKGLTSIPLLNDGGSIILTGSAWNVKGTPAFGVYGATKAAIRTFVRTWTTDLNVVSPGRSGRHS